MQNRNSNPTTHPSRLPNLLNSAMPNLAGGSGHGAETVGLPTRPGADGGLHQDDRSKDLMHDRFWNAEEEEGMLHMRFYWASTSHFLFFRIEVFN